MGKWTTNQEDEDKRGRVGMGNSCLYTFCELILKYNLGQESVRVVTEEVDEYICRY